MSDSARSLEPFARPIAGWRQFLADLGREPAVNGLIGFIFAATGPVAVILSVGVGGGLSPERLASWIFGVFFLNSLLTIAFSLLYRRPLAFFWTIPGTVLVGPALGHLAFSDIVGAFIATGLLMLVLGLTGWVKRIMQAIPMSIVMAMVAGVFLRFGTDLVYAVRDDWPVALPMIVTFLLLSALPALGRRMPPVIGALIIGVIAVALGGGIGSGSSGALQTGDWFAAPVWVWPTFSAAAMIELVVPLAITVLVVQNGQGVAVLKAAGHEAPVNAIAAACGAMSVLAGFVGGASTCLTGPTNALVSSSGDPARHYAGAVVVGLLGVAFGLFAPLFTQLMLATPPAWIATLAGLAMLRVLQTAFTTAFGGQYPLGALVTFVVTVAGVPIAGIGAPFWGLVFGSLASAALERPAPPKA